MNRRPLVRRNGCTEQLPEGDMIAGIPVAMPAFQASGVMLRLVLRIDYALPAVKAGGTTLHIPVILNA